ncbi:MAG: hypothetical protein JXB32_05990 [Deltaproteobacteria bacterium]|nr:hypothetical protein [Deltaproteobacteria bacterium]
MQRHPTILPAAMLALAAASAVPAAARAARASWIVEEDQRHDDFGLTAVGGWYLTGFGAEARVTFPIVPDGAIEYLNESFALELGVGYQFYLDDSGNFHRVGFPVLVRWDFHLTTLWTVYGALGVAAGLPLGRANPSVFWYHGYVWPIAAVGAFLHLGDVFSLRFEAGSLGVLAGVHFSFGGSDPAPAAEPAGPA